MNSSSLFLPCRLKNDTKSHAVMTSARMPLSSKATLSAALAKARTAVQLDQAQYHDGAKTYYAEVVELLARVITRASNEKDIKKLEDIRRAYTNRIRELDELLAYA